MEAASSSPAGNGIDQGRGQWEGAHHAPSGNLHVSQGRRGAQNVPQGRSGSQDRRGPQGKGRAQNALTRDTPRRERRGRVGRGRSGRRSAGRGGTLAQALLGTPHTVYRLREMGSSSSALYRLVRSETRDQGCQTDARLDAPEFRPGSAVGTRFSTGTSPINGTSSTPQTLESRSPVPLDIVIPGQDTGAPIGAGFESIMKTLAPQMEPAQVLSGW
ncbi:hypothetical protein RRG08_022724 [Elysia crispata]|uniref:Uncharacterized protein n=1 Tax=Elysia crispata TaxID=231223 RepID=A0AAE0ZEA6_9GAST|nr:hypothetical protein RRG08_022724 [Elysia crispata]